MESKMDPFFTSAVTVKPRKRKGKSAIHWKFPDHRKPVVCVETGERFESAAAAGRSLKTGCGKQVTGAIARGGACHGFTFQYVEVSK